jgi:hypothetical protein
MAMLAPPVLTKPLPSVELPPLPALPGDDSSPEALLSGLLELVSHAKMIPRDLRKKAEQPALFEQVESAFLACLARFPSADAVPAIDGGATVIEMPADCRASSSHPGVHLPGSARIPRSVPPACFQFYGGQHKGGPERRPVRSVECALPGFGDDLIYTFYDDRRQSHQIAMGSFRAGTGFVAPATALAFDGDHPLRVWVAGDFRVRAFIIDGFREHDLLYVGTAQAPEDVIVTRSALAVWRDLVVLAHGRRLTGWRRLAQSAQVAGWGWRGVSVPPVIDSAIERRRGRARVGVAEIAIGGDIDRIAATSEFLAIASTDAPTIHVARCTARQGEFAIEVVCRLIGHTAGITALVSRMARDGPELFSGSADGTVKSWSLNRREILFSLQLGGNRRAGQVTAIRVAEWRDPDRSDPQVFVISGYRDALLRLWDLSAKCPVFELAVEREAPAPLPQPPPQPSQLGLLALMMTIVGALKSTLPPGTDGDALESALPAGTDVEALQSALPAGTDVGALKSALSAGTDVGALMAQVGDAAKPQLPPARRSLVPLAIDFSVARPIATAELNILAVEPTAQGLADGELLTFTFPFGKEGEQQKV